MEIHNISTVHCDITHLIITNSWIVVFSIEASALGYQLTICLFYVHAELYTTIQINDNILG